MRILAAVTKGQRKAFLELPYQLYREDQYWVAPPRIEQRSLFLKGTHPFLKHGEMACFLAMDGEQVLGRVAAILDHGYRSFHGDGSGFFGFFECTRNEQAARGLLKAAGEWLANRECRWMIGPMNPNTNYECGLLIEGFDSRPMVMMSYNPPWYQELLEGCELTKIRDLHAFLLTEQPRLDLLRRVGRNATNGSGVVIRHPSPSEIPAQAARLADLYREAWRKNWGYSPFSDNELQYYLKQFQPYVSPSLLALAEKDGQLVGFGLVIPDFNEALQPLNGRLFPFGWLRFRWQLRKVRAARLILLGVDEEYRRTPLLAGLAARLIDNGLALGYRSCEISWVLEDNTSALRALTTSGAEPYKKYRVYQSALLSG